MATPWLQARFGKCVDAELQPLRDQGIRVFFDLDDFIVMARSIEWAIFHTASLVLHLTRLSFAINWEKSAPQPSQQAEYLGVVLNSVSLLLDPRRHKHSMVNVPPSVQEDLHYWGSPQHLSTGTPLGQVTSSIAVFTEVSLMG